MTKTRVDILFDQVLDKFEYKTVGNRSLPVLVDGGIADLMIFIKDELDHIHELEELDKLNEIIKDIDPNEGDPGSAADQEGDYQ